MSSAFDPHLSGGPASYIHWKWEHSRYAVELRPELIAHLSAEVSAARDSGMEAGGVLIGSFPPMAFPTLRIEGYVRVQRRNEDGPFYTFTPEQQERFTAARRNANTRETSAVGFFRSHRRDGELELSPEDRALLAAEFKKSIHVALLVEAREPRHAVLYLSADGAVPEQPSIPKFLFDVSALRGLATVHPSLPERRFERPPPPVAAEVRGQKESHRGAAANYALVMATAIGGFAGGFLLRPMLPPSVLDTMMPASAQVLDLHAALDDRAVRVMWNHKAPELQRAKSATVEVAEGLKRREIHLDGDELRWGALEFEPSARQALIIMTLEMPGGTRVTQSVTWEGY